MAAFALLGCEPWEAADVLFDSRGARKNRAAAACVGRAGVEWAWSSAAAVKPSQTRTLAFCSACVCKLVEFNALLSPSKLFCTKVCDPPFHACSVSTRRASGVSTPRS